MLGAPELCMSVIVIAALNRIADADGKAVARRSLPIKPLELDSQWPQNQNPITLQPETVR